MDVTLETAIFRPKKGATFRRKSPLFLERKRERKKERERKELLWS
jgi:hypothetical protein